MINSSSVKATPVKSTVSFPLAKNLKPFPNFSTEPAGAAWKLASGCVAKLLPLNANDSAALPQELCKAFNLFVAKSIILLDSAKYEYELYPPISYTKCFIFANVLVVSKLFWPSPITLIVALSLSIVTAKAKSSTVSNGITEPKVVADHISLAKFGLKISDSITKSIKFVVSVGAFCLARASNPYLSASDNDWPIPCLKDLAIIPWLTIFLSSGVNTSNDFDTFISFGASVWGAL